MGRSEATHMRNFCLRRFPLFRSHGTHYDRDSTSTGKDSHGREPRLRDVRSLRRGPGRRDASRHEGGIRLHGEAPRAGAGPPQDLAGQSRVVEDGRPGRRVLSGALVADQGGDRDRHEPHQRPLAGGLLELRARDDRRGCRRPPAGECGGDDRRPADLFRRPPAAGGLRAHHGVDRPAGGAEGPLPAREVVAGGTRASST